MPKVLVCGDYIEDHYVFGEVSRICPEAPVPVLSKTIEYSHAGGAGLVAKNLESLGVEVRTMYGLPSKKTRFMAGHHLLLRVDEDAKSKPVWDYHLLESLLGWNDAAVVSDYGKGTIQESNARKILELAKVPVFVDSKKNHGLWKGAFACFPNEHEQASETQHVIRKLGSRGCEVDGVLVPTETKQVYDVTGAGDVFLAAFVWDYLEHKDLLHAAGMANKAAGISVEHLGTYVVKPDELYG